MYYCGKKQHIKLFLIIVGLSILVLSACSAEPLDSDGDGWSDKREEKAGTNALNPDTDGDGIWDDKDDNPLDPNIPFVTYISDTSTLGDDLQEISQQLMESGAAEIELTMIQSAVVSMMADLGISSFYDDERMTFGTYIIDNSGTVTQVTTGYE